MQSEIKFVEKYFLTAMIRFATAAESPFFVAITSPGRSLRSIYSGENYFTTIWVLSRTCLYGTDRKTFLMKC